MSILINTARGEVYCKLDAAFFFAQLKLIFQNGHAKHKRLRCIINSPTIEKQQLLNKCQAHSCCSLCIGFAF